MVIQWWCNGHLDQRLNDNGIYTMRFCGIYIMLLRGYMDQYLLIPFLGGWTSIYQLFWCSPGVQGFDTLPFSSPSCWTEGYTLAVLAIDAMSSQGTVSRSPTKAAPSLKSRAPIAPLAPAETWLPEVGCIQLKSDWWQRQDLITIHDIHMCVDKAANRSCSWMNDFHG